MYIMPQIPDINRLVKISNIKEYSLRTPLDCKFFESVDCIFVISVFQSAY